MKTPLASVTAAQGALLGTYAGAETAAHFGDVDAEFHAITETVGVYDLGWRGKILISGEDRTRWLNGMVTNNVRDLKLNQGNYNFVLNAQGRIQGDLYAYNRGEYLLADTERSQVPNLMKLLDNFIIMDAVELEDITEKLTSIGVQGPQAQGILDSLGIKTSCADPLIACDVEWNGIGLTVTRMVSEEFVTFEFWLAAEHAQRLWDALIAAGAKPVGFQALERFRIVAGVPKYGTDIREKHLVQETAQMHAVSFSKGCYVGQEIVERIHARTEVHRTLTGFESEAPLAVGSKVLSGEKEVGEITSAASLPASASQRNIGLGFIRKEAAKNELTADGKTVQTAELPFHI